jgi:hypothetical protein
MAASIKIAIWARRDGALKIKQGPLRSSGVTCFDHFGQALFDAGMTIGAGVDLIHGRTIGAEFAEPSAT